MFCKFIEEFFWFKHIGKCQMFNTKKDKEAWATSRLCPLVRRRIRCGLIYMYNIMHGFLNFPCDTFFAAPTRIWLRGHTFKIHQQRCKTRRRQHAFSGRVVPYWNRLAEDIQVATGCTVAVPLPRSSPLIRPPIIPPEFVPICRFPPLCYYCNYSWSSIVIFTLTRPINVI